ncbi:type I-E CRISPR-associated endoribonuclease Cas2 [Corynebacterium diphtheriae]|nr:type I-E CRISPR-associated endoribonuclease Cas2 [Corynebacterium diphtheriae]
MGYPVLPLNPILSSPLHGQLSRNTGLNEAVSVALESCQESLRLSNGTKKCPHPLVSDNSRDQGFSIMTTGNSTLQVLDADGLSVLATRPGRAAVKLHGLQ